jgi:isoamylase
VSSHDAFTRRDLVSYNDKHNEANGEGNADGESHNRSWNHGAEGPTDDTGINALRARQQRNFLATLMLSQGVPMLLAGDEIGRTQHGNNNGYCQDNELSWIDWENADRDLLSYTVSLLAFRRAHPVFRRRRWFEGRPLHGQGVQDIVWFTPAGDEMSEENWKVGFAKSLMVYLNGAGIPNRGPRGEAIVDDSFLLCFNAHHEPMRFTLPSGSFGHSGAASSTRRIPIFAPAAPLLRPETLWSWPTAPLSCFSWTMRRGLAPRLLNRDGGARHGDALHGGTSR